MTRQLLGFAALFLAALVVAPVAGAEPGAYSQEDDWFYRSLTEDTEDSPGMVLTNPPLVRAQGLEACHRIDDGVELVDAADMLMVEGPYSWDVASSIVAAATVFLCPEVR